MKAKSESTRSLNKKTAFMDATDQRRARSDMDKRGICKKMDTHHLNYCIYFKVVLIYTINIFLFVPTGQRHCFPL